MAISILKDIRQDSPPEAIKNYRQRGVSESGHGLWIWLSAALGREMGHHGTLRDFEAEP